MGDLHRPKTESFDIPGGTNTDPKGFVRSVDRWDSLPGALYMARPADHPRFGYLESWLIPALTLRVNRFHFRNGSGHGPWPGQELYVDIADVVPGSGDGRGERPAHRGRPRTCTSISSPTPTATGNSSTSTSSATPSPPAFWTPPPALGH